MILPGHNNIAIISRCDQSESLPNKNGSNTVKTGISPSVTELFDEGRLKVSFLVSRDEI